MFEPKLINLTPGLNWTETILFHELNPKNQQFQSFD